MSISQLISIICIFLFILFALIFCLIVYKLKKARQSKDDQDIVDIEQNNENRSKPPKKIKRKRKIKPCFYEDQIQIRVPSNTPTFVKFKRKQFQPMNYEEGCRLKRKKHKSLKRIQHTKSLDHDKNPNSETLCRTRSEYFSSNVKVEPLQFSETHYTKNYLTEKLFAGSIHMGYKVK